LPCFARRLLCIGIGLLPRPGNSGSAQKETEQETAEYVERFH
jgi:hypothetical protein